jgi:hypothetical protein
MGSATRQNKRFSYHCTIYSSPSQQQAMLLSVHVYALTLLLLLCSMMF